MKKCEVHPFSMTVGVIAATLILFACSSSSPDSSTIPPQNPPTNSSVVAYYSDVGTPNGNNTGYGYTNIMGTATAGTVITDVSSTDAMYQARLLVNGTAVYAWNNNSSNVTDYRFALTSGIPVPAGAEITIESSMGAGAVSIAGYTY